MQSYLAQHIVKITNIVGPDENEKNSCRAGENVKLKLSGVEEDVCFNCFSNEQS